MTLRDELIACGAVRFGEFTLTSGARSPYYVDIKRASSDPRLLTAIGREIARRAVGYDRIAGMELGAVPIATATALASGIPFLMIRKKPRDHGTGSQIEGPWKPGERALVVEDVTTSGGSSLQAVEILRKAGLAVDRVVTVVDREQGASEAFRRVDVALEALVTAGDLLKVAKK